MQEIVSMQHAALLRSGRGLPAYRQLAAIILDPDPDPGLAEGVEIGATIGVWIGCGPRRDQVSPCEARVPHGEP